jgi:tartrate dehydrogenase/decarboxylase/D-malate dehydrogenase
VRIAAIPGDGIGPEVVGATLPVLRAAAAGSGIDLDVETLDWGGDRLLSTGSAMPVDGADRVRECDGILFGAVGRADIADERLIWGLIIALRQQLDLAVNLRPVQSWPAVSTALRSSDHIDMLVVRENTEGEYVGAGGRVHRGTPAELGVELAVHSRPVIERTARHAFEQARQRRGRVSLVTKSNAMRYGYTLWDEVVAVVGADFPEVELEVVLIDAMVARMVQSPGSLDVLLCSNLFGDILSDLAGGLVGSLGLAPSANITPGRRPGLFEPVHGSAPDIAGRGIANPVACLLSGAMLFDHAGLREAGDRIRTAVRNALGDPSLHTPDLGGSAGTADIAGAVLAAVENAVELDSGPIAEHDSAHGR